MASAIGTSTACAQYRTTTTSTHPANVTQGFTVFDASSITGIPSRGPAARSCASPALEQRRARGYPSAKPLLRNHHVEVSGIIRLVTRAHHLVQDSGGDLSNNL